MFQEDETVEKVMTLCVRAIDPQRIDQIKTDTINFGIHENNPADLNNVSKSKPLRVTRNQ